MPQVRARLLGANLGTLGRAIAGEGSRLAQQQMNVLRHDNVPIHTDIEMEAHILQALNEQIEHLGGYEIGTTAVTTKSYKMTLPGFVKAPNTAGHDQNLRRAATPGKYTIVGTPPSFAVAQVSAQKTGANLGHLAIQRRESTPPFMTAKVFISQRLGWERSGE
ncbi:MAG: hypothetical protein LAO23_07825 [Acidobacteriia bacterium]|nr:hypothetical protein [Terriglobia bacterium]